MVKRRIKAWWGPGPDEVVEELDSVAIDDLLDRLEHLGAPSPFLVDLADEGGNVLSIGVGSSVTVLTFIQASQDPPYLISHAKEPIVSGTVWFDYAGAESEFTPDQVISRKVGRAVAREFAASGDLSGIDWAEV